MGPYRTALNVIQVETPCREDWAKMDGTDVVRFCRVCESHVYHLSEMSMLEVEELLEVTEGRACVRFAHRADGTVVTKDCSSDRARHRRRQRVRAALGGAAAVALAGATAAVVNAWPAEPPPTPRSACHAPRPTPFVPRRTWIDPDEAFAGLPRPDEHDESQQQSARYMMGGAVILSARTEDLQDE